jgi:DNA-binding transcriptional ArsR family regulator
MTAPDPAACLRVAQQLKTVSGIPQLTLLMMLGEGERSVSELSASPGVASSTASFQLALLRVAGVVTDRRDGQRVLNSLTDKGRAVLGFVEILLAAIPDRTR